MDLFLKRELIVSCSRALCKHMLTIIIKLLNTDISDKKAISLEVACVGAVCTQATWKASKKVIAC